MEQITFQNKYRPAEVKYLFLGEAFPCTDGQFFYYEDIQKKDNLFIYLIRSVFSDISDWEAKMVRNEKKNLLERFMREGYFIDFCVANTIEKGTSIAHKSKLLKAHQQDLLNRIAPYKNQVAIILLTATVFKVNYDFLISEGFTVLNHTAIPYPGSGQQGNFKQAMSQIGFGKL